MSTMSDSTSAAMPMTFFTSTNTQLFSQVWTPASPVAYAFTCIFLIAVSVLLRFMNGVKSLIEAHWLSRDLDRRSTVSPRRNSVAPPSSTTNTHQEDVSQADRADRAVTKRVKHSSRDGIPIIDVGKTESQTKNASPLKRLTNRRPAFQLNVDLPRAIMYIVTAGLSYLVMLALMTMNVGYFMSVLGGLFLGELLFGRWATVKAPINSQQL